jgi:quercetin dioxygenase-like cupin family protein
MRFLSSTDLLRPQWTLPEATDAGFARGLCLGLSGTNADMGLIFMPVGQTTPPHSYTGEHLIFQLMGTIEFSVGDERHLLQPHDILFIPADLSYVYSNVGLVDAAFVNVTASAGEWPARAIYDQGEQIRGEWTDSASS